MNPLRRRTPEELDAIWKAKARRLGIPPRLWGMSFATAEPTAAMVRMRELDDEMSDPDSPLEPGEGPGLILAGPSGVGKSAGATAFLRARLFDDDAFFFVPSLIRQLLHPETRDEAMDRCESAELVVLDDIGGYIKVGGLAHRLLEQIFIIREGKNWPLIASTNLTITEFSSVMGERVMDRLRGEWGVWFSCTGMSMRTKARRTTRAKATSTATTMKATATTTTKATES